MLIGRDPPNRGRLPKGNQLPKDWEDEYRKLHSNFQSQKVERNKLDSELIKLRAANLKLSRAQSTGSGGVRNRDNEMLVDDLKKTNEKLTSQIDTMTKRNATMSAELEKKTRQLSAANRRIQNLKPSIGYNKVRITRDKHSVVEDTDSLNTSNVSSMIQNMPLNAQNSNEIRMLQERLIRTEAELKKAHEQNKKLLSIDATTASRNTNSMNNSNDPDGRLREANWKFQQLQTRFDLLTNKCESHALMSKSAEENLEKADERVKSLRRALEDLRQEKSEVDRRAAIADDLEDANRALRMQVSTLEDRVAALCESPFSGGNAKMEEIQAGDNEETRFAIQSLQTEREALKVKVEELEEAVAKNFKAVKLANESAEAMKREKRAVEAVLDETQVNLQQMKDRCSIITEKLHLYSSDADDLDHDELDRALTAIQRAGNKPLERPDFLEDTGTFRDEMEDPNSNDSLKRRIQNVQAMNVDLQKETEHLKGMLKIEAQISKDLREEIASLATTTGADSHRHLRRAEDAEELANRRLLKIQSLEAQLREYVYSAAGYAGGAPSSLSATTTATASSAGAMTVVPGADIFQSVGNEALRKSLAAAGRADAALLAELLRERGSHLQVDENLMEVWVRRATILPACKGFEEDSTSFVMIDFFEFESQATPLAETKSPEWDYATTYKLKVDDFLLRYLAGDTMSFEVMMAVGSAHALIAKCELPLASLLKSKAFICLENHPLISASTQEPVATLSVEIRLAVPITELYRLFCERNPEEANRLQQKSVDLALDFENTIQKAKIVEAARIAPGDDAALWNELEILIDSVADVKTPHRNQDYLPSPYVHFTFLGHPERFTAPVANVREAVIGEHFTYTTSTAEAQLRLLRRGKLEVSLWDMNAENRDDGGILGRGNVNLLPLSQGESVDTECFIYMGADVDQIQSSRKEDETPVGRVRLRVRWVHNFRRERGGDPNAISGPEVKILMSSFAYKDNGDKHNTGIIKAASRTKRMMSFYELLYYIQPPDVVTGVVEKLRTYALGVCRREGLNIRSIFGALVEPGTNKIIGESFLRKMQILAIDVLPNEYVNLFTFLDREANNEISYDSFIAMIHPVGPSGVPAPLQHKIANKCLELTDHGQSVEQMFKDIATANKSSSAHYGLPPVCVSRKEFELVLIQMGFDVLDKVGDEEVYEEEMEDTAQDYRRATAVNKVSETEGADDPDIAQMFARGNSKATDSAAPEDDNNYAGERSHEENMDTRSRFEKDRARLQGVGTDEAVVRRDGEMTITEMNGDLGPNIDPEVHSTITLANNTLRQRADEAEAAKLAQLEAEEAARLAKLQDPLVDTAILGANDYMIHLSRNMPNFISSLRKEFGNLDRRRFGIVPADHFQTIVFGASGRTIPKDMIRVLVTYFTSPEDPLQIDYEAFMRMCDLHPPPLPDIVRVIRSVPLTHNLVKYIRGLDVRGSGVIDTNAMVNIMQKLAGRSISYEEESILQNMFESPVKGFIDYASVLHTFNATHNSQRLQRLESRLRSVLRANVLDKNGRLTQEGVYECFHRFTRSNEGTFGLNQLEMGMKDLGIDCPRQLSELLIESMTSASMTDGDISTGLIASQQLRFSDFDDWLSADSWELPSNSASRSIPALQRKARICHESLKHQDGYTYDKLLLCFHVFDWTSPPSGFIAPAEFKRACENTGFLFSHEEILLLCKKFAATNDVGTDESVPMAPSVEYNEFLEWACPREMDLNASGSSSLSKLFGDTSSTPGMMVATAIKLSLQAALRDGYDLLALFRAADRSSAGLLTADAFVECLRKDSSLSLPQLTEAEAMALAGILDAASSNHHIMYAKVVNALLSDDEGRNGNIDSLSVLDDALSRGKVALRRLRDMFEYYDRKQNGQISASDLPVTMEELGLTLQLRELNDLISCYGDESGVVLLYRSLISALEAKRSLRKVDQNSEPKAYIGKDLSKRIMSALDTLVDRGVDMRGDADALDVDIMGSVPTAQVETLLRSVLGLSLKDHEMAAVKDCYTIMPEQTTLDRKGAHNRHISNQRDNTRFDHLRFLRDFHPPKMPPWLDSQQDVDESIITEAAALADEVRLKVRRKYSRKELKRPFRHFARRRGETGATRADLELGLTELGLDPSADVLEVLFRMIAGTEEAKDSSGEPTFRYPDFVVFVCDAYAVDVILKLQLSIEHASSLNNLIAALNVQDVNSTGIIRLRQFDSVFHSCGMDLTPTDTQRFSIRFDLEDEGTVDIERCFSYLRRLSLSKDGQTNSNGKSPEELAVDMCLSKVANKIRGMMEGGSSHDEILRIFALDGKNLGLDIGQLHKGCRLIGVELSRELARGLLRKLCLNVRGLVDRTTFLRAVLHTPVPSTTTEAPTARHTNASVVDEINRALRLRPDLRAEFIGALLKAQQLQGSDLVVLERDLKQADTHQLGEVERSNFLNCLHNLGVHMPVEKERELAEMLGVASGGAGVNYEALMVCLEDYIAARVDSSDAFDKFSMQVVNSINEMNLNIEAVFDDCDKDHDGKLNVDDFLMILRKYNPTLERPEVISIMSRLSHAMGTQRNHVTFLEFDSYFSRLANEALIQRKEEIAEAEARAHANIQMQQSAEEEMDLEMKNAIGAIRNQVEHDISEMNEDAKMRCQMAFIEAGNKIDFTEFMQLMEQNRFRLESSQIDALFDELDPHRVGHIDSRDFLNFVGF